MPSKLPCTHYQSGKRNQRRRTKHILSVALSAAKRWKLIAINPLEDAVIVYGAGETQEYESYTLKKIFGVFSIFKNERDVYAPTQRIQIVGSISRQ